jgi:hypothetical protein
LTPGAGLASLTTLSTVNKNLTATDDPSASARKSRVCYKCGHENPPKVDVCQACSAHLYLVCRKCHHRNFRALGSCEKCGDRLRAAPWKKLRKKLFRSEGKIKPVEIIIAIVLIPIFYKLALMALDFFSGMSMEGV